VGSINFEALGENLIDSARSQFEEFLLENRDVDNFLVALGRRYATLAAQYHLADSEEARAEALSDLRRVKNTINLKLDAVAHLAKSEILSQLKAALGMVLDFAIKNLPTIIAIVRR
jgi:hypothetical protein